MDERTIHRMGRIAALLLACVLAFAFALPATALAQDTSGKTVRVGWYESSFNATDEFGRRSGYAYEYQRKVAAYTGWNYDYVEGSWPELLQMLKDGEIDLLSDVSYTEERTEDMLYASLPMGTESYYVMVAPGNSEISADDFSTLNGKRVGIDQGSIQRGMFVDWADKHGVDAKIVDLNCPEDEYLRMLQDGEIDALVTLDSTGDPETVAPLWKIGSSDFYFAVSKDRPDLLVELDTAMSRLQDENKYYNQQLYEKCFRRSNTDCYLSPDEQEWLLDHGPIRVGYQDNYLAFCASDEATGELIGALDDYLDYASTSMENGQIDFEAISYPTAAAALEALQNGEVDCMFPANLTEYDGEKIGVAMTPPLMRTEMDAVVRAADQREFIRKDEVVVCVNEGNTNYEMFLLDNYPGWQVAYYPDTPAGLEAIAAGEADCVIISNYRYSNIAKQCERLHLTTVYTGVDMDYCLAVREGDTELYSILTKVTGVVPDSIVHAALTYYSTEDAKTDFGDFIRDHLGIVMSIVAAVLAVILILLLRGIRAEKKARAEEHLVDDLSKRVFVDALTSVRNKGAYVDYIQELQERADREGPFGFAIGVFDCDNLKTINDRYGHDKGDVYLQTASRLICRIFQHSPVFRIGGDEFAVVLMDGDFENREQLARAFEDSSREACAAAENEWEEVHVSFGIAVHDPDDDSPVADAERRADKVMYENKRLRKAGRST